MCGFAGFCSKEKYDPEWGKHTVNEMASKIQHRGPDGRGVYSDGYFSAGFCRLKIIDLDGGDQPMTDESGRYTLCYNGEIYNYKSLRTRLITDLGVRFRTASDTEVLLQACIAYGRNVLSHLRGMYSFVFYDSETGRIFCARDPFGIKPMYYGMLGHTFIFASEIKAFYAHPDFKAEFNTDILPLYLQFQYTPTEETAFRGIKRLLPAHYLEFDGRNIFTHSFFEMPKSERGKFRSYSFFSAPVSAMKYVSGIHSARKNIDKALNDSVKAHLVADTEVGAFLSGGVDSATVAAMAKPKKLYTVGFDEEGFDERPQARETAKKLGLTLNEKGISARDFFRALPAVQYHSDEPCGNLSAVPLYLLAERASSDVKAVLSGEGADELFAGYSLYNPGKYGKLYRALPKKLRTKGKDARLFGERVHRLAVKNSTPAEDAFIGQARIMSSSDAYNILSVKYRTLRTASEITYPYYKKVKDSSELQKMLYLDRNLWMPFDILNKADKMTMAHSVELRVPYLDLKVLAIAQTLSDKLLISHGHGKYALRKTAIPYVGKEAAFRSKKGFPVPFREWIKKPEYCELLRSAFKSPTCEEFFDSEKLVKMLNAHIENAENNARVLYTVYSFIVWYDIYFGHALPSFFMAYPEKIAVNRPTNENTRGIKND